jgi:hypothetical protein
MSQIFSSGQVFLLSSCVYMKQSSPLEDAKPMQNNK